MAKFCGNCGTMLDDDAKICGQCGAPLEGTPTKIPNLKAVDPEKQKKKKKIAALVIALVVIIIVAIIVISVVSQSTGYNGLLRETMTAYENYDIDKLISLSSDIYYYFPDSDFLEYYYENNVGEDLDYFDSSVGHNYHLTYEVKEIYDMPERTVAPLLETFEQGTDFDITQIEQFVVADIEVTAEQEGASASQEIEVVMTKENGAWKLLYLE